MAQEQALRGRHAQGLQALGLFVPLTAYGIDVYQKRGRFPRRGEPKRPEPDPWRERETSGLDLGAKEGMTRSGGSSSFSMRRYVTS